MKRRIAALLLAITVATPAALLASGQDAADAPVRTAERLRAPLFMGVELIPVDGPTRSLFKLPSTGGLLVIGVAPGSPADGKLGQGDILLKLDDQVLVNREQVRALVRSRKASDTVVLGVSRGGRPLTVEIRLAEVPAGLRPRGEHGTDPARHEELLRGLTDRTRRMLGQSGLGESLLDEAARDVSVTVEAGGAPEFGIVTTRTYSRPEGRVTLVTRGGKTTVTVKGADGKVLADGELSDETRAKMPEWAKSLLENRTESAPKGAVKPAAPVAKAARGVSGAA